MKKKILVVDDNRMILKFLTNFLEREGHEIKTCEDGLSVLSLLTSYEPDIAFIDLILPKISGDKLCQIIRTMAHMKHCYIVIISAAIAEMDLDFESIGVDACIAKGPFGEMGKHVLAAISDADDPCRSRSDRQIRGIASVSGIPVYARRMTKELLGRNRHLETILESMTEAIIELYTGKVVYANSAAVSLFDIPLGNLISAEPADLFGEVEKSRIDRLMNPTQDKAPVVGLARPFDINDRQVVIRSFPVIGETDTKIFLITDVTEQRNLEYQLQHVRRMDAIGNIAGGIAHNFNNLLMGIQGNASILGQDKSVGDSGYEEISRIEGCIESGAKLTRQLLSFAKGGRYSLEPVDINLMVEKSSNMFARTRKEFRVQLKLDADPAMVQADSVQMELATMELFVNAWHAMAKGGTLTVATGNADLDEAFVKPYDLRPGKYVTIEVADTGSGMDESILERVFEPFYTTRHMCEATGLGLSTVFGIIKKHMGIITVNSQVDVGTTFTIHLPSIEIQKTPESADNKKTIPVEGRPEKGTGTILVVDDEEYILNADKVLLENLGYEVVLANSGEAALRIFNENKERIDVMILDLVMPDVSGEIVYQRIKAIRPDLRVILSSGYGIEEQAESILKGSRDGFIQKPYNLTQLGNKIKQVLS